MARPTASLPSTLTARSRASRKMSSRVPQARPFVVKRPDSTRANARSAMRLSPAAAARERCSHSAICSGPHEGAPRAPTSSARAASRIAVTSARASS